MLFERRRASAGHLEAENDKTLLAESGALVLRLAIPSAACSKSFVYFDELGAIGNSILAP
jgi:hypothetical protein